jgi:hypothetical protein
MGGSSIRRDLGSADHEYETVPNGSHRIYGRIAGGVQADMVSNVAVTLTATRTIDASAAAISTGRVESRFRSERKELFTNRAFPNSTGAFVFA